MGGNGTGVDDMGEDDDGEGLEGNFSVEDGEAECW